MGILADAKAAQETARTGQQTAADADITKREARGDADEAQRQVGPIRKPGEDATPNPIHPTPQN